jgi:cell division protein FtsB
MGQETYSFNTRYKTILTAFLAMLLVYLTFHLFVSERSIPSLLSLSLQEKRMETQLVTLTNDYDALKGRVIRLRPETLDADLVEEYSIQMLGHGTSQAIILLDGQS